MNLDLHWETLFYSNRANTLFFFGDKKESDRIVLHNFETHSGNVFFEGYSTILKINTITGLRNLQRNTVQHSTKHVKLRWNSNHKI